jgi:hypothetical protein
VVPFRAAAKKVPLITSDGKFAEKMKGLGWNVSRLDDWKPD